MKRPYRLTKNSEILIYGAGALGELLYKIFKHHNFHVYGFVDKRAYEMNTFNGLPVMSLDSISVRDNMLVVIAIKDVYSHEEIAARLLDRGFLYIIYKPLSVLKGIEITQTEFDINRAYDTLIDYKYKKTEEICLDAFPEIPSCEIPKVRLYDSGTIHMGEDEVSFMAALPLVFTVSSDSQPNSKWTDRNILFLTGHTHLFSFFDGKFEDDTERYIEFCRDGASQTDVYQSKAWEMSLLDTRYHVWSEMNRMLELSPLFFQNNPASGVYSKKNRCIHLTGGRHRVTFLISKSFTRVPVVLSRDDYEQFINQKSLDVIWDYMKEQKIYKVEVPVPHPFFYHIGTRKDSYVQAIMRPILEELSKEEMTCLKKTEFLLDVNDNGEMKRVLKRMNLNVTLLYSCNKFETLLDQLFYDFSKKRENKNIQGPRYFIIESDPSHIEEAGIKDSDQIFLFGDRLEIQREITMRKWDKKYRHIKQLSSTFWDNSKIVLYKIFNRDNEDA